MSATTAYSNWDILTDFGGAEPNWWGQPGCSSRVCGAKPARTELYIYIYT